MAYRLNQTKSVSDPLCACCGRPVRQLKDHQTLLLVLRGTLTQQRGSKCINCGQVNCVECCHGRGRCACGSNAWVAMPYIGTATVAARTFARTY